MPIISLAELKPRERGKVTSVAGPGALRRRIMDLGIVRGTGIEMTRSAPLGDPVEVVIKGYNLTLRKEEAENVYVEVES